IGIEPSSCWLFIDNRPDTLQAPAKAAEVAAGQPRRVAHGKAEHGGEATQYRLDSSSAVALSPRFVTTMSTAEVETPTRQSCSRRQAGVRHLAFELTESVMVAEASTNGGGKKIRMERHAPRWRQTG
ncbi:hypothetical protein Dimus_033975, partial [Dionaea muscipula]